MRALDPAETAAIEQMCKLYGLEAGEPQRNMRAVWTGRFGEDDIRIASYGTFVNVDVAFGGAIHTDLGPMGLQGLAGGSSSVATPDSIQRDR